MTNRLPRAIGVVIEAVYDLVLDLGEDTGDPEEFQHRLADRPECLAEVRTRRRAGIQ